MRLALLVPVQTGVSLEPFGTFDAVVSSQTGKILVSLGLLVQLQMSRGCEISLDLVDVAVTGSVRDHIVEVV